MSDDDFLTSDTDFEADSSASDEEDRFDFDDLMQATRENMEDWATYWKQQFEDMFDKVRNARKN